MDLIYAAFLIAVFFLHGEGMLAHFVLVINPWCSHVDTRDGTYPVA